MVAERVGSSPASAVSPSNPWWWRRDPQESASVETDPEATFVTLCVREPEAVAPGTLTAAAASVQDWPLTIELASRHRVTAYVLEASTREAIDLPPSAERELRRAAFLATATVLGIDAELRRVVGSLAAADIPALVLKGPALARTLYPRVALRPYGDIDLTIQERHQEIVVGTLLEHGYSEIPFKAEEARREHAGHLDDCAAFHRQFTSGDGKVLLELHADPMQLGLRQTGEAVRWQRARDIPGMPGASMLGLEDQVVQLSAHVHKHGFDRLIWLKDLDLLLRAHQYQLDWDVVERVARDEGVLASVWYSLHLTKLLLATPIPATIVQRLRPALPIRLLYGRIWPATRVASLQGFMRRRAVQFHAAESWRGMLPSLILMGRRRTRVRAIVRVMKGR
jgi:hypothetical protein